jgi:pentapeptide MXKDX repeat protein
MARSKQERATTVARVPMPCFERIQQMTFSSRTSRAVSAVALTFGLMLTPAAFAQHKTDTMGNDTTSKDTMSEDAMSKDTMSKDTMKKDTMGKDAMSKDTMGKDTMAKDSMTKDKMKK